MSSHIVATDFPKHKPPHLLPSAQNLLERVTLADNMSSFPSTSSSLWMRICWPIWWRHFLIEVSSSQTTLACVKLTETDQASLTDLLSMMYLLYHPSLWVKSSCYFEKNKTKNTAQWMILKGNNNNNKKVPFMTVSERRGNEGLKIKWGGERLVWRHCSVVQACCGRPWVQLPAP